jgi:nitrogen fixation/metabolism regulation signal transduction histidine kinase
VILSLLVAALLGLVQVRRTMRPLRDLADAAARIGAGLQGYSARAAR